MNCKKSDSQLSCFIIGTNDHKVTSFLRNLHGQWYCQYYYQY